MKVHSRAIELLLIIAISSQYAKCDSDDSPMVTVGSLGQVRGSRMKTTLTDREFLAFRGIPYAKPPVGKLRLKDPVPLKSWGDKIIDGTKEGPACVQYNGVNRAVQGVEDCLKLNIYTHDTAPDTLKPVMVWIHGGGFNFGSANGETDFYGPGYLLDRDIVLVTINYRLGALGFMTTEDSEIPGNYGLLDQSLALRWVRDHIRNFGGDNESVTIFGESAGGASVDFHILSPHSQGLFDRAIAQSGSAQCVWAHNQVSVGHYSRLLIKELKCDKAKQGVVECLRTKDAAEFGKFSQKTGTVLGMFPFMFSPRIDVERENPFLPDSPAKMIEQKRFNHVPYITGVNKNEGSLIALMLLTDGGKPLKEFKSNPSHYIAYFLGLELHPKRKEISEKIRNQYLDSKKSYFDQLNQIEQLNSDNMFFRGIDNAARLYAKYSDQPTYYYHYEHKGQYGFGNFINFATNIDLGVNHGDEIFLIFSNMLPAISSESDIKMSNIILDLWTSFASNGKPTSASASEWLPMENDGQTRFLRIATDKQVTEEGSMPFHHRLAFWDNLFDTVASEKDEL